MFFKIGAKCARGAVSLNRGQHLLTHLPALHLLSFHSSGKMKDLLKGGERFLGVWSSGQNETARPQPATYASEPIFCREETSGTQTNLREPSGYPGGRDNDRAPPENNSVLRPLTLTAHISWGDSSALSEASLTPREKN